MARLILAVIAGYLAMIGLVIVSYVVLEGAAFSFTNLLLAFPFGFAGGWLSAKIAREREVTAGLWLALLNVAMGVTSYELNPRVPIWYWTALASSLGAGAVYGAFRKWASVQKNAPRKKKKVK